MINAKINKLDTYLLRVETGKELYSEITKFCKEKNVKFAEFKGIGAVIDFEYGVYEDGKYTHFKENRLSELISMIGNISFVGEEYVIHSHATFCNMDENKKVVTFAGHLFNAKCGVTVEIVMHTYKEKFERKMCDQAGLKVLDLDKRL